MYERVQFHISVNMKNEVLNALCTFIFSFSHLLFFIGSPTLDASMQTKKLQENEMVAFATLVSTRRPRSPKDGALVHASGDQENGNWRPLVQPNVWVHVHRRSLEVSA